MKLKLHADAVGSLPKVRPYCWRSVGWIGGTNKLFKRAACEWGDTRLHNTTSRYVLFEQRQPVCHSANATRRGPKRLLHVWDTQGYMLASIRTHTRPHGAIQIHHQANAKKRAAVRPHQVTANSQKLKAAGGSCAPRNTASRGIYGIWRCQLLVQVQREPTIDMYAMYREHGSLFTRLFRSVGRVC